MRSPRRGVGECGDSTFLEPGDATVALAQLAIDARQALQHCSLIRLTRAVATTAVAAGVATIFIVTFTFTFNTTTTTTVGNTLIATGTASGLTAAAADSRVFVVVAALYLPPPLEDGANGRTVTRGHRS